MLKTTYFCRDPAIQEMVNRKPSDSGYLSAIAQAVQQDKQYLQYNMVLNQRLSRAQLPRTAQLLYDIRQAHTPHELDWKYDRGYQDMNHATLLLWAEAAELTKTGVHVDWTVAHNVAFSTNAKVISP